MKNFGGIWKKTVFRRLIISFICILMPIYILSIAIYYWGIGTLRGNISNSMISQVSFYLQGLEKNVQRVQSLQYDLLNDDNLNRLATIPESLNDIEKVQNILQLQQRLIAMKNSSLYVKEVFVHIPAMDKSISSSEVSELDKIEYDKLKNIPPTSNIQVVNLDGRMILNASYPFAFASRKKEPLFTVNIELSEVKIKESLNLMLEYKDEGIMFMSSNSQYSITTGKDPEFNKEIQKLIKSHGMTKINKSESIKINNKKYLAVYSVSDLFGATFCKYIPEDAVFKSLRKFRLWFVILTFVALNIIIIYSFYMHKFIHNPLSILAKSFKQVESGDLEIFIDYQHDDEFRYIYKRFNVMVENLNVLIDQVYRQKILVQKAEMKQLQSQINPHFLYNSFFTLNTMSQIGDYENLERFTEQLGEYFQFITRSAADEVPLAREVHHAKIYTEIQGMRFSKRLKVEFHELPDEFSKLMVPRLILQPILENAFEHGLEKKAKGGLLVVKFSRNHNGLAIVVEDNGDEVNNHMIRSIQSELYNNEDNIEVTAMINIYRRIQLKFGAKSGVQVMRGELGGLKVIINIDLMEGENNV